MGFVDKKENIESIQTFKVWIRRLEEWQTFENTSLSVFSLSPSQVELGVDPAEIHLSAAVM